MTGRRRRGTAGDGIWGRRDRGDLSRRLGSGRCRRVSGGRGQGERRGGDGHEAADAQCQRPQAPARPAAVARRTASIRRGLMLFPGKERSQGNILRIHRGDGTRIGLRRKRRGVLRERADDRIGQPLASRLEVPHHGEHAGGGGTLRRVLGQAALDQRPHRRRHPVEVGRLVHHPVQQRGRRPRPERSLAGRGERQHGPQAEDVTRRPDLAADRLLRRHEPRRSEHYAGLRQRRRLSGMRDAEVDDPRAVLGQQHVRRLQVTVHHSRGVDGDEALRQPRGQRQQRRLRQRPVAVDRLFQRGARDVGGGQPRHRAIDVRIHHHGGVHAADPPRRGYLLAEPDAELAIGGQLSADGLHRDRPPARGDAEEHLPHPALAEPPHQAVRANRPRIPGLQFANHAAPSQPARTLPSNGFVTFNDKYWLARSRDCPGT
jgi:hypothetical protein